jgi:hypothetical protein
MAITRPIPNTALSVTNWGGPITDEVNRMTPIATVTPWTALPYNSPWTNFGSGYQVGQYRKNGDNVEVRGFASPGTSAPASSIAYTLPVGFRPPVVFQIVVFYYNGTTQVPAAVNVNPSGTYQVVSGMTGSGTLGLSMILTFSTI